VIVGYTELQADFRDNSLPGMFHRRVFWVKSYDRCCEPTGTYETGAPAEAVDPRTVQPGVEGELTDRAWAGQRP
jgi:Family of unknown function (DUF6009)